VRPCNKNLKEVFIPRKRSIYISIVKRRERECMQFCRQTIEERVYQTFKVVLNGTSIFCRKNNGRKYIV